MAYPQIRYGYSQPAPPAVDPRRTHQIDDFIREFSFARVINRDRSLLELPMQFRDGRMASLQISLPQRFPDVAPIFSVSHPIQNMFVDSNRKVNLPVLSRWHPGLKLVDAVKEAQNVLLGQTQVPGHTSTAATSADPAVGSGDGDLIAQALQGLSDEDLGTCLVDDGIYKQLAAKVIKGSQLAQERSNWRTKNKEAALANLAKEAEIQELVNQIAIIKSSEYADAKCAFDEKREAQIQVASKISVPGMREKLQQAARKLDEDSDEVNEQFLSGDVPLERFCEEYRQLRINYYTQELTAQAAAQIR